MPTGQGSKFHETENKYVSPCCIDVHAALSEAASLMHELRILNLFKIRKVSHNQVIENKNKSNFQTSANKLSSLEDSSLKTVFIGKLVKMIFLIISKR